MSSIFTKIVEGEIPCHRIAETEKFLAFLDIQPLAKGHTLIIPKNEVDYIFDLSEEDYIGMQLLSRYVAQALKETIDCKRIGTAVLGLEVPHAHIHLIPINSEQDLNFGRERLSYTHEELAEIAAQIREKVHT